MLAMSVIAKATPVRGDLVTTAPEGQLTKAPVVPPTLALVARVIRVLEDRLTLDRVVQNMMAPVVQDMMARAAKLMTALVAPLIQVPVALVTRAQEVLATRDPVVMESHAQVFASNGGRIWKDFVHSPFLQGLRDDSG